MSRYIIFFALSFILFTSIFGFIDASSSKAHKKRRTGIIEEEDVSGTSIGSDMITTTNNNGTASSGRVPPSSGTSVPSGVASLDQSQNKKISEEIRFLDSFDFNEEILCGSDTPLPVESSILDGPFRADYMGKTIILNRENSPIPMEEFFHHFVYLNEVNLVFKVAASLNKEHYFTADVLNVDVDSDGVGMATAGAGVSSALDSDPLPPLHPLFLLAREIVVYNVGMGRLIVLKEAHSAGMNLNFDIIVRSNGLKLNLLHFACIMKSSSSEVIEYLIKEVGFDPNQRDSDGYTPFHHVACQNNAGYIRTLLLLGGNPNLVSRRPNYIAPIHVAAKLKNYEFLKPLLDGKVVDINVLNFQGQHLIHYAIELKSFSFFSYLLKDSSIILEFPVVAFAFRLISCILSPLDIERFNEVLIDHLLNRRNFHESQIQFIIFNLIMMENLPALKIFYYKGFNFRFTRISQSGRPNSTPLLVSVYHNNLESFKFLVSIGISLTENLCFPNMDHIIILAIYRNSFSIIKHLLDTQKMSDTLISDCLKIILKFDLANVLNLFLAKFGDEIWGKFEQEIDPRTNPDIFILQNITFLN